MTFFNGSQGIVYFKASVRAATTADITLSGPQTIDAVSVVAGDRVLVKDQSTGANNGIYVVAAGAWTRATDFAQSGSVKSGLVTFVTEGSVNGDKPFWLTTNDPITLGTTSLVFASVSGTMAIGNTVTSGTTGSVLFVGAASVLAQDNANFFWDNTNKRLGIGTAAPTLTLHVVTNAASEQAVQFQNDNVSGTMNLNLSNAGAAAYFQLKAYGPSVGGTVFGGAAANRLFLGSNGASAVDLSIGSELAIPIVFGTNAIERMRILSDGKVGIGTATPAYKVHVRESVNGAGARTVLMNPNTGTAAQADLLLANSDPLSSTGAAYAQLAVQGTAYTTDGLIIANWTRLSANSDSGGLLLVADGVGQEMVFATAGHATGNERLRLGAAATLKNISSLTIDTPTITLTQDTNFAISGGVNGFSVDGTTFSIDGTNKRIGIGTSTPTFRFHNLESVNGAGARTVLMNPNTGTAAFVDLILANSDPLSSTGAAYTSLATLGTNLTTSGLRIANWSILSSNSDSGGLLLSANGAGQPIVFSTGGQATADERFHIGLVSGASVFNDPANDIDLRVEGTTDANLLFVDASANKIGIGTSTPAQKLDVRGSIVGQTFVSPQTATTSPAAADSRTAYTNEGAAAQVNFNLPTAAANLEYTFVVQDTDGIQITAATGDTIRVAGSVSATAGTAAATTIGNVLRLLAINATEWIAVSVIGTWTVT